MTTQASTRDIALLQEELRCLREKLGMMVSQAGGYTDQLTSPGSSIYPDEYRENCGCIDVQVNDANPQDFCQTSGGTEGQIGVGDLVQDVYSPGDFQGLFEFDAVNGVFYKPPDSNTWQNRNTGLADTTLEHGCLDVWWYRKNTPTEDNAILYRVGTGKVLVSPTAGRVGWQDRTPTPPTGYTSGQITYKQIVSDPFTPNSFYLLATNGNKTWIVKTTDNFQSTAWLDLTSYNSVVTRIPIWMALKGNGANIIWVTTWGDDKLRALKLNNGNPITVSAEYDMGDASQWDVENYFETLSPVSQVDTNNVWFYGRASNPQSLGLSHIIRTTNDGSSWSVIENTWGLDWCGSLKVGFEGVLYAYRNLRGIPSGEPELVGEVSVASGGVTGCNCGFVGASFFDGYTGIGYMHRSTVNPAVPSTSGRTQIHDNGTLSTLGYHHYNSDLNAFIAGGLGAMYISPPASGSPVPAEIDSTAAYVGNRASDYVTSTDLIAGNPIGASPPLYGWLANVGTTGDWNTFDLGDTSPAYHTAFAMISTNYGLMTGVNSSGNLYARIVHINSPNLESIALDTSSIPCETPAVSNAWLRKVGTDFVLLFNNGTVWQVVTITVNIVGASVSIGTPTTVFGETPYDIYTIDDSSLAVVLYDGQVKYTTLSVNGSYTNPVIVYASTVYSDSLAVGYTGGYALISYVKTSDDELYVASVVL